MASPPTPNGRTAEEDHWSSDDDDGASQASSQPPEMEADLRAAIAASMQGANGLAKVGLCS